MVGGHRLVGAAVDMEAAVEEIGFDQAVAAVGAEAADLAMGHLAGREAGHHPIGKTEGGVDVVDRAIATAATGGRQLHHRRRRQFQHQIDVMDHQIQHHRHIVGPVAIGAVAPCFEHHHLLIGHHLGEFAEGGVEALDMAHLQQPGRAFSRPYQVGSLLLASRDRLFN